MARVRLYASLHGIVAKQLRYFISRLERFQNNSIHCLVQVNSGHHINRIFCAVVQTHLTMGLLGHTQIGFAIIYRDIKRSKFQFARFCCNSYNIICTSDICANDRQQIVPALDRQRACARFQVRCTDRALLREVITMTIFCVLVYLPNLSFKVYPGFCIVVFCVKFCLLGCLINCRRYLRVGQIQRPALVLIHRLTFEGKRVAYHRTATRGNGARTIVRGVALFVLKLHGDIIAPNGVKMFGGSRSSPIDLRYRRSGLVEFGFAGGFLLCAPSRKLHIGVRTTVKQGIVLREHIGLLVLFGHTVLSAIVFMVNNRVVPEAGVKAVALAVARGMEVAVATRRSCIRLLRFIYQLTFKDFVRLTIDRSILCGAIIVAVCNDLHVSFFVCIVEVARLGVVEANFKVRSIRESTPVVVTVLITEPFRPTVFLIHRNVDVQITANSICR